ncbi:MAG: hypothetical protein ACRDZW_10730, partial [Acidimicrobiales bacterium]
AAAELVEAWADRGAVLLGPADLSTEGWVVALPAPVDAGPGSFVAGGQRYESAAISAVVVRLAHVDPVELVRVVEADRIYAASEMTALLAHWLESLSARVVNRPSPAFLWGPGWSTEEWLTQAARVGLPTVDLERVPAAPPAPLPPLTWATVAGTRVVGGAAGGALDDGLQALAAAAGASFLAAGFTEVDGARRLARVSLCPAVGEPVVRQALADLVFAA